jgi:hypothetical protein
VPPSFLGRPSSIFGMHSWSKLWPLH